MRAAALADCAAKRALARGRRNRSTSPGRTIRRVTVELSTIVLGTIAALMIAVALAWVILPMARRASGRSSEAHAVAKEAGDSSQARAGAPEGAGSAPPNADARQGPRRRRSGTGRAAAVGAIAAIALGVLAIAGYLLFSSSGSAESEGDVAAQFERPRTRDEAAALAQRLQVHLARKPRDARAWVILGRLHTSRDEFAAAVDAYDRAIAASTKVARDPQVLSELADALGMANGGVLAGRPRELAEQALLIDAAHSKALDLAGSAAYEAGDYRAALAHWRKLLGTLNPQSEEHAELTVAIERARRKGQMQP